jgi:hypothetical protein
MPLATDIAQGASNAVAGTVSAPVDILSWLLRKGGMGNVIGDAPVGGSEWMARKGLTKKPESETGEIIGESLGNIVPMVAAAKAPQLASGVLKAGENYAKAKQLTEGASVAGADPMALIEAMREAASKARNTRMSKAQSEALGYTHKIGDGAKLQRPFNEMTSTHVDAQNVPPLREMKPEEMQGSLILPALGDRSIGGKYLTSVNEQSLTNPLLLEGGPRYMAMNQPYGSAWASDKGPITGLAKRIRAAGESGKDVYLAHSAMGHASLDHNTMMTEALLDLAKQNKISGKGWKALEADVRKVRPDFAGFDDSRLFDANAKGGELRKALVRRMALQPHYEAGFPDVAAVRKAITEPELLEAPVHAGGFSIAKMDPAGRAIPNPEVAHSTYPTGLAVAPGGQSVGGLSKPVPRDIFFRNFAEGRRAIGAKPSGDDYSFLRNTQPQEADQRWVDEVSRFLENAKRGQ